MPYWFLSGVYKFHCICCNVMKLQTECHCWWLETSQYFTFYVLMSCSCGEIRKRAAGNNIQLLIEVKSKCWSVGYECKLLPRSKVAVWIPVQHINCCPVTNCMLLTVAVFFQLIYFYFSYELQSGIIGEFQPVHCISFLAGKKGIHHSLFL